MISQINIETGEYENFKFCNNCNEKLDISNFHKSKRYADGLEINCIKCNDLLRKHSVLSKRSLYFNTLEKLQINYDELLNDYYKISKRNSLLKIRHRKLLKSKKILENKIYKLSEIIEGNVNNITENDINFKKSIDIANRYFDPSSSKILIYLIVNKGLISTTFVDFSKKINVSSISIGNSIKKLQNRKLINVYKNLEFRKHKRIVLNYDQLYKIKK